MSDEKRILVTFGRSDPLHLTETTIQQLVLTGTPVEHIGMVWGPDFNRPFPTNIGPLRTHMGYKSLRKLYHTYDVVYCGHGATLLEATAAGCEVMVLCNMVYSDGKLTPKFRVAWSGLHLDHSCLPVRWWETGVMAAMSRELVDRRRGVRDRVEPTPTGSGASWVHQRAVG